MALRGTAWVLAGLASLAVQSARVQGDTVISVEPNQIVTESDPATIEIRVRNVLNLGGFQFDVVYDQAVVNPGRAELGVFLGSSGRVVLPVQMQREGGRVRISAISAGQGRGADGEGVLASLVLVPVARGQTTLSLDRVKLIDPQGALIPSAVVGGQMVVGSMASAPVQTEQSSDFATAAVGAEQTAESVLESVPTVRTRFVTPAPSDTPTVPSGRASPGPRVPRWLWLAVGIAAVVAVVLAAVVMRLVGQRSTTWPPA